jgi:putative ABC transport system ATP-binding protein
LTGAVAASLYEAWRWGVSSLRESASHRDAATTSDVKSIDMDDGALVRLIDVHKVYRTGEMEVPAVRGVSVEIKRGEFVALMGASGSGKSTLMNILGCLDRPTTGHYILDGADVSGLDRDRLADIRNGKIGFVFQSFNLLPRTSARENVELPLVYSAQHLTNAELRERADRVLASVGLTGREDHHPSQLSGGQQQRVAIARALINEPEVLLADEPTGNLDSRTSVEIMAIFQQLNERGITVIMVTHEPDIAAYAKRNVMMRDGVILDDHVVSRQLDATSQLQNGRTRPSLPAVRGQGAPDEKSPSH